MPEMRLQRYSDNMPLHQLLALRDNILRPCTCCDGRGVHVDMRIFMGLPMVNIQPCGLCVGTGLGFAICPN